MKIRRANPKLFEPPARATLPMVETPRQRKRRELDSVLQEAVDGARLDAAFAYRVTLEADDKLSGVRAAFKRVKARAGATEVNLVTVGSSLYIAQVPRHGLVRPSAVREQRHGSG